jgi:hypothetical protein
VRPVVPEAEIRVECYAGYRGDETPRRLVIGERTVEVEEVLGRWVAPDHRGFELLGDDGAEYRVRHVEARGAWELDRRRTARRGGDGVRGELERALGGPVEAIAVMGKWEPTMRAEDCLGEVRARAAAALALDRALGPVPGRFFLCAEGLLRRMPRPGCEMAAEILIDLGAPPERIMCWPSSNCTLDELANLDRMRARVGARGLVLVTSGYHVPRTRHIQRKLFADGGSMTVVGCGSALVRRALASLPGVERAPLEEGLVRGDRHGVALARAAASEVVAFLAGAVPHLERTAATIFRGDAHADRNEMARPNGRS